MCVLYERRNGFPIVITHKLSKEETTTSGETTMIRSILRTSKTAIQFLSLGHVVNEKVFEVTVCVGPSMLPTFNRYGDVVLVDRGWGTGTFLTTETTTIGKGDVVVSRSPTNPKHLVCKRVVAIGGERVEKRASASDANRRGRREEESDGWSGYRKWDEEETNAAAAARDDRSKKKEYVTIPDGHVWLQGDNEGNSTDSRDYGPVPMEMLRGRVFAKVWPIGECGWVGRDERYALRDEKRL
jgi:inner membrane protease subunit 1